MPRRKDIRGGPVVDDSTPMCTRGLVPQDILHRKHEDLCVSSTAGGVPQ